MADRVEKQKLGLNRKKPRQALARRVQTLRRMQDPCGGSGAARAPSRRSQSQRRCRAGRRASAEDRGVDSVTSTQAEGQAPRARSHTSETPCVWGFL